jgi:hypothetical protein
VLALLKKHATFTSVWGGRRWLAAPGRKEISQSHFFVKALFLVRCRSMKQCLEPCVRGGASAVAQRLDQHAGSCRKSPAPKGARGHKRQLPLSPRGTPRRRQGGRNLVRTTPQSTEKRSVELIVDKPAAKRLANERHFGAAGEPHPVATLFREQAHLHADHLDRLPRAGQVRPLGAAMAGVARQNVDRQPKRAGRSGRAREARFAAEGSGAGVQCAIGDRERRARGVDEDERVALGQLLDDVAAQFVSDHEPLGRPPGSVSASCKRMRRCAAATLMSNSVPLPM